VTDVWRYVESDGVSASAGLAGDECLQTAGAPALRLYTYRSHCALVGKFQNLEAEIDLGFCRGAAIAVNRRPTGGGAILMGDGQLGIAVVQPSRAAAVPEHPKEIFARYGRAIMRGLERLGIRGSLEAKNDIRIAGRKIAGLGVCRNDEGTLLFHTSLLVDLDVDLMLRVLKIPPEKISDKLRARVADNLTTVRREIGRPITTTEVREAIRDGFAEAERVALEPRAFGADDDDEIARIEQEKYLREGWIFRRQPTPDANGSCLRKTPAGLLRLYLSLAGDRIKDVTITGDFVCEESAVLALEKALARLPADEPAIAAAVSPHEPALGGLAAADLVAAILEAAAEAKKASSQGGSYGCFVDVR
jgi:lipoate---protein ligase